MDIIAASVNPPPPSGAAGSSQSSATLLTAKTTLSVKRKICVVVLCSLPLQLPYSDDLIRRLLAIKHSRLPTRNVGATVTGSARGIKVRCLSDARLNTDAPRHRARGTSPVSVDRRLSIPSPSRWSSACSMSRFDLCVMWHHLAGSLGSSYPGRRTTSPSTASGMTGSPRWSTSSSPLGQSAPLRSEATALRSQRATTYCRPGETSSIVPRLPPHRRIRDRRDGGDRPLVTLALLTVNHSADRSTSWPTPPDRVVTG
jgi:hypothetical protein